MTTSLSSRDRMLAVLECRQPDHVPFARYLQEVGE